ncbi:MAG: hypothetical protein ABWX76_12890 [Leifsonia flava]
MTAALLAVVVTGCAVSPTTTVIRKDGSTATVNWADYPGTADHDIEDVLAAPHEDEVEPLVDALFVEIQESLDSEFELAWSTTGDAGWYPTVGNGYGGESSFITYNSQSLETDSVPPSTADWKIIINRVSAITERHGLGPVTLDHDTIPPGEDPELWRKAFTDRFGTDDPDEFWMWNATALHNSQWLWVTIVDVDRDPTGSAAEEYDVDEGTGRMIGFFYGATTIRDDERDAFIRALEPFEGLEKPPASHSD